MPPSLTVMVTRPGLAGQTLCQLIDKQGDQAIPFPTITFGPPQDPALLAASLEKLGEQEWLIFISPQSVFASIPAIRQGWPIFPPSTKFAAVGEGTARALHEAGYQVNACPLKDWNSEGLLDLPEFKAVKGVNIAIIRGEGGREHLDKELAARGAQILPVIAYQRQIPRVDTAPYLTLLKQQAIDVIICTSFESVKNLKSLLQAEWENLKGIPLIVVSERIKTLAQDLDFQTIWLAANASHEAILRALEQKKDELCLKK